MIEKILRTIFSVGMISIWPSEINITSKEMQSFPWYKKESQEIAYVYHFDCNSDWQTIPLFLIGSGMNGYKYRTLINGYKRGDSFETIPLVPSTLEIYKQSSQFAKIGSEYVVAYTETNDFDIEPTSLKDFCNQWLSTENKFKKYDINGDGIVNLKDYALLLNRGEKQ